MQKHDDIFSFTWTWLGTGLDNLAYIIHMYVCSNEAQCDVIPLNLKLIAQYFIPSVFMTIDERLEIQIIKD